MPSVSLPVTRPAGPALIVGTPAGRTQPMAVLERLGFTCAGADDPYAAMAELARGPAAAYRALVLSLQHVYPEELELIPAAKRRFPQLEVWLADTDGRQAALAEAMTLGADGLLSEEGLHRLAAARIELPSTAPSPAAPVPPSPALKIVPDGAATKPRNGDRLSPAPVADRSGANTPVPGGKNNKKRRHRPISPPAAVEPEADEYGLGEAILTAEELRALLQEPTVPVQDVKTQ